MEEGYDTNREDGAERMDVEGTDRPSGDTSHHNGPMDVAMETTGMGVSTTTDGPEQEHETGVGGGGANDPSDNLDPDQRQRSSRRVVKPRVVYLAELEGPQQSRGGTSDERKQQRKGGGGGQDQQGVFGVQVPASFLFHLSLSSSFLNLCLLIFDDSFRLLANLLLLDS